VRALVDPQGRGRQHIAARLVQLTGTRAGGFVLTREEAAGKWGQRPTRWSARDRGNERQGVGGIGGVEGTSPMRPMVPMLYGNHWLETVNEALKSQRSPNCLDTGEGGLHGKDQSEIVRLVCPCEAERQARERGEQGQLPYFGAQPRPSSPLL
jgi:hypothetical protein